MREWWAGLQISGERCQRKKQHSNGGKFHAGEDKTKMGQK
jgi:hypothetical protein